MSNKESGRKSSANHSADDKFSFHSKSFWLASETSFLHFHLLRTLDTVNLLSHIVEQLQPRRIICLGPDNNLTKIAAIVAGDLAIDFRLSRPASLRILTERVIWQSGRWLSRHTCWQIRLLHCAVVLRDVLKNLSIHWRKRGVDGEKSAACDAAMAAQDASSDVVRITFLATNKKQFDIVQRLYQHFDQRTGYRCSILNIQDDALYRQIADLGLAVDNLSSGVRKDIVSARGRFAADAVTLFNDSEFVSAFCHKRHNYWSVSSDHFIRYALAGAPHLYSVMQSARRHFASCPADVVVTPGEWATQSRAVMMAAALENTATISVQRGDITEFPGWGGPLFSDKMTLNGAAPMCAMQALGVDAKKLAVTGDPRLDPWVSQRETIFSRGAAREEWGIPSDKSVIAVMTNPVNLNEKASHAEAYISGLFEAGLQDDSLYFVIKLHPSEFDLDFYRQIQRKYAFKNAVVVKEYSTPQLLFDADAVVTTISTTGEEAIFLGRPLLAINLTNEPDFMPYIGHAAAITVRQREEIAPALQAALHDDDRRAALESGRDDYIHAHFHAADGLSAERFEQLLPSLLASRLSNS